MYYNGDGNEEPAGDWDPNEIVVYGIRPEPMMMTTTYLDPWWDAPRHYAIQYVGYGGLDNTGPDDQFEAAIDVLAAALDGLHVAIEQGVNLAGASLPSGEAARLSSSRARPLSQRRRAMRNNSKGTP